MNFGDLDALLNSSSSALASLTSSITKDLRKKGTSISLRDERKAEEDRLQRKQKELDEKRKRKREKDDSGDYVVPKKLRVRCSSFSKQKNRKHKILEFLCEFEYFIDEFEKII